MMLNVNVLASTMLPFVPEMSDAYERFRLLVLGGVIGLICIFIAFIIIAIIILCKRGIFLSVNRTVCHSVLLLPFLVYQMSVWNAPFPLPVSSLPSFSFSHVFLFVLFSLFRFICILPSFSFPSSCLEYFKIIA